MDDSIGNPLESTGTPLAPGTRRFLMNAGRTTKQGQQVSSGKYRDDYKATVSTMHMHPDDMKDIGVPTGSTVRVRSLWGEETFKCVEGKTPERDDLRPLRSADLPFDGTIHGRNGDAPVEGLGGRGRAAGGTAVPRRLAAAAPEE